jgi:SHS2 domain-containing protein
MKQKFTFLEHTADVKFQAFGKTVEECFKNSALAMFNSMFDGKIKSTINKKIKAKGKNYESLLYNFLEELLFLFDTEHFFISRIKKLEISLDISDKKQLIKKAVKLNKKELANGDKDDTFILKAELVGDKAKNYEIHLDVKAITYNEMFVRQEKDKWVSQVVVDV